MAAHRRLIVDGFRPASASPDRPQKVGSKPAGDPSRPKGGEGGPNAGVCSLRSAWCLGHTGRVHSHPLHAIAPLAASGTGGRFCRGFWDRRVVLVPQGVQGAAGQGAGVRAYLRPVTVPKQPNADAGSCLRAPLKITVSAQWVRISPAPAHNVLKNKDYPTTLDRTNCSSQAGLKLSEERARPARSVAARRGSARFDL
jgi:hypothetical protein